MMARLIICSTLLIAFTLPSVADAADSAHVIPVGYTAINAGYASLQDEASKNSTGELSMLKPPPVSDEPDLASIDVGCAESCGPTGCCPDLWTRDDFLRLGQFYVQGWVDQGFTLNPASPENRFNTPVGFNDRSNDYQMNQLYLVMGRRPNTEGCKFDYGARVDLLYGSDYYYTTAAGLETYSNGVTQRWNTTGPRAGGTAALYGLAMPQLYAEFYLPWRYGTTVKVGHFNTILGYESVMAPQNFFYSHSYMMIYGEPKTHTGFLASYQYAPRLTFHAGMTRGWDSWEDPTDRAGFLGGVSWSSCDGRTNVNFAISSGDEHVGGESNRTVYSLVLMQQLNCRWTYVFQQDYGVQDNGYIDSQFTRVPARWYGISQYLFYAMSDVTSLGFRFEWFRDEENSRVLALPIAGAATGKNYYEATLGINWHPSPRFTVRPEVRWDWSDVTPARNNGMYNDFLDKNQFTFATDLVFVF